MIPLRDQDAIRHKFAMELGGPVKIEYFTEREVALTLPNRKPCVNCKPTRQMLQELAGLSDAISLRIHYFDEAIEDRTKFGVQRIPAIVLRARGDASFTFYGMPGGTEFPGFLDIIVDISRGEVLLSPESIKALQKLEEEVRVQVFVSPACPYCPHMARAAFQMAMVNPKVKAEVIEVTEFPDLAEHYKVRAVPLTVIADRVIVAGAMHEKQFVESILKATASPVGQPVESGGPSTPVSAVEAAPARGKERDSGLIIP